MKNAIWATALMACFCGAEAAPALLSGFESGLAGWQTIGDVSAQSAASGLNPTEGTRSAFLTTMSSYENPFSGTASPIGWQAQQFLGLPIGPGEFMAAMPDLHLALPGGGSYTSPEVGESGAMKLRFYVDSPSLISFDWNRIGRDYDSAYFSLWADDSSGFRINDWLWANPAYYLPFGDSGVDLCSRTPEYCTSFNLNGETGWHKHSLAVMDAGWYYIGFAMGEVAEGTVPSVLALDNLQIQSLAELPEPNAALLAAGALAALGISSRRRKQIN